MALIVRFREFEYKGGKVIRRKAGVVRLRDGKIVAEEDDDGSLAKLIKDYILNEDGEKVWAKDDPRAFLYGLPMAYGGTYFNCQFDEDDEPNDPLEEGDDTEEDEDLTEEDEDAEGE